MEKLSKIDAFIMFLWPHNGQNKSEDKELTEKLFILTISVLSLALIIGSMISIHILNRELNILFYTNLISLTICLLLPIIYRLTKGSYKLTAGLISILTVTIITLFCYKNGNITSPSIIWMIIIPAINGIIFGKKGAIFGGVVSILSILFLYFTYTLNPPPLQSSTFVISKLRNLIISNIVMTTIIYFSQNNVKEKISKINQSCTDTQKLLTMLGSDIKNPLNIIEKNIAISINTSKKYLEDGSCNCLFTKSFKRIEKAAHMIKEIIQKTSDPLQKLDNQHYQLELHSVDPIKAISDALFILSEMIEQKDITIHVGYNKNESFLVNAENTSLTSQVLSNLISNAVKFSNAGSSIYIEVKNIAGKINISIKDEGIGIPVKLTKILFSSTKQTSRIGTNGEKGTGFGMPLVKRYIEYYGGSINVLSKTVDMFPNNHGTTFTIILNKANKVTNIKKEAA